MVKNRYVGDGLQMEVEGARIVGRPVLQTWLIYAGRLLRHLNRD
jgi:hypothetical protein